MPFEAAPVCSWGGGGVNNHGCEKQRQKEKNNRSWASAPTVIRAGGIIQCCGAGAGGAEIIWDLEPEPEPKLNL